MARVPLSKKNHGNPFPLTSKKLLFAKRMNCEKKFTDEQHELVLSSKNSYFVPKLGYMFGNSFQIATSACLCLEKVIRFSEKKSPFNRTSYKLI